MCAARFAIPPRLPSRLAIAPVVLVVVAVAGCPSSKTAEKQQKPLPTEAPPKVEMAWDEQPLGGVASSGASEVPVKEGPAPLVYLTSQGENVRVVDRTANRVLGEMPVPARTIIRVDQRTGVVFGKQTLVAGPLPAGRRYGILVVPSDESTVRTGRMQQVEPKRIEGEESTDRVAAPTGTAGEAK
jgi:hypothetical protein